ncbi:MAG: hypothetical protein COC04_04335 [Gammaproteobacteria bacterium]|nr:MAG: hypothetical protein COC04_04335 [Gammaproteobacteria bacterium]
MKTLSPILTSLYTSALTLLLAIPAQAATFNDNWQSSLTVQTYQDARTDDNQISTGRWDIDPGADIYEQELYERPTSSMDKVIGGKPAAQTYYEYLDIVSGKFALDTQNQHAYFSIDLVGPNEIDGSGSSSYKGFGQFYRIRVADNSDFFNGYLFGVKDPDGNIASSNFNNDDNYKTTQLWDDQGTPATGSGLTVTGEGTTGYDEVTSEGSSDDIQARIVGNSIELAIAYGALGIDSSAFDHFIFEATKGLTDVQNYFWNDEYTLAEAGSPYDINNPVDGNIYELDTLKGMSVTAVPVPAALWLFGPALLGLFGFRRSAKLRA